MHASDALYTKANLLSQKVRLGEKFAWAVLDREKPAANDCRVREKSEIRVRLASGKLFPGQYFDQETGLHYNYYRDYDPSTGRYIESDPIGLNGGLNTFAYVNANVLNNIDIYGLAPHEEFPNVNATVVNVIDYARTQPLNHRIEYCGWIHKLPNGCYTYEEPVHSNAETGPDACPLPEPKDGDVEWWHTHPDGGNAEHFSLRNWDGHGRPGDQGVSEYYNRPGNLGAPSNHIYKLIPHAPKPPEIIQIR